MIRTKKEKEIVATTSNPPKRDGCHANRLDDGAKFHPTQSASNDSLVPFHSESSLSIPPLFFPMIGMRTIDTAFATSGYVGNRYSSFSNPI